MTTLDIHDPAYAKQFDAQAEIKLSEMLAQNEAHEAQFDGLTQSQREDLILEQKEHENAARQAEAEGRTPPAPPKSPTQHTPDLEARVSRILAEVGYDSIEQAEAELIPTEGDTNDDE